MTVPNTEKSVFTVKKESVSRKEFIKKKKITSETTILRKINL